ncbi:MarR family winged helix-turn-helix transcriptional regulator [Nonomuraea sp. NPDC005650]|uniref:MarR family winged helix-turn-helix transcriptional regulator n=1 Tax=Nonomuraea sp. NPDC005650 TaxID=3157045 RepID=UPI0033A81A0A
MTDEKLTRAGTAATQVILATFRANGAFQAVGDELTSDLPLTTAQWQVMGPIVAGGRPLTVAQIARRMGLTRQSVHALVRRLVDQGLVEFAPNADHRRSPLVQLTDAGSAAYSILDRRQVEWANRLGARIPESDLETAERVLITLCQQLERPEQDIPERASKAPGSVA